MPEILRTDAPDDLRALLNRLAGVEPRHAAGLYASFLGRARLEKMSDAELAELVDTLPPRIQKTAAALRFAVRQSPLPLTDTARGQLAALFTLYRSAQSLANLQLGLAASETDEDIAARAAAHRARVDWAARLILDCYQLYVDVPRPLFTDLHQVARAAHRDLGDIRPAEWEAIRASYVAILLLAMINPYALTVDEMADLNSCLREVAGEVEITVDPPAGSARFIDISGRLAPHIAVKGDEVPATTAVYVGVERLYRAGAAERLDERCRSSLKEFLRRLHFFLTPREERQGEKYKTPIGDRSLITIGFYSVHHRLLGEMLYSLQVSRHLNFSGLDWEGLERPVSGQVKQLPTIRDFKLELDSGGEGDVDWEARPDALGMQVRPRLNEPAIWDVVNLSERGLRLHWRLADNSRAAVDELILIEQDPDEEAGGLDAIIGLGVIRWVRHLDEANRTIDMGVERLAGNWMAYFAYSGEVSGGTQQTWPVLARVAAKGIDRIILPSELAERSDRLTVVREQDADIHLNLERVVMVGSQLVVMEASKS